MPNITFSLVGETVDNFIDDWAYSQGYTDTVKDTDEVTDIPNPLTKQDYLMKQFIERGKNLVLDYRKAIQLQEAEATIVQSIKTDLNTIDIEM